VTRSLLSSDAVTPNSEPVGSAALLEPSRATDARIRELAHAALIAQSSAPRIACWERTVSAALIASYAAYVASQVLRIFSGGHG
jgi:hypothetical protein